MGRSGCAQNGGNAASPTQTRNNNINARKKGKKKGTTMTDSNQCCKKNTTTTRKNNSKPPLPPTLPKPPRAWVDLGKKNSMAKEETYRSVSCGISKTSQGYILFPRPGRVGVGYQEATAPKTVPGKCGFGGLLAMHDMEMISIFNDAHYIVMILIRNVYIYIECSIRPNTIIG